MNAWDIIVVGAGIAGVSAVRTIVTERPGTTVLLVNGENVTPYKRTKVSKKIAEGFDHREFLLEDESWYSRNNVQLCTGTAVVSIDPSAREVTLAGSEVHSYGSLILAPGAEPLYPQIVRPHDTESFLVVRTDSDVQELTRSVGSAKKVLIDGMGVLAVEVAEQLVTMGKKVTMVGATPQLMPRHLTVRASEILEELLVNAGVKLRYQEEILSFEPREKGGFSVSMIRESLAFDLVILCIGVVPRVEVARAAGVEVDRGILVDRYLRTSDPHIYAAGDAAQHRDVPMTDLWHAAEYQGEVAAVNALGGNREFDNPAFRLKCEVFDSYFFSIGKPRDYRSENIDEYESNDRYQCFFYTDGRLSGAVMVNDKEKASRYQEAVREGWDRRQVAEAFR